jgi:hypothetical protein
MAIDFEQLQRIHRIATELKSVDESFRQATDRRAEIISELDEYHALQDALAVVRDAKAALRRAIAGNAELANLEEERADLAYQRRDVKQTLSHHLVAYHDETGRDTVKDLEGHTRQLELSARYGKPTLDQPRLPLGMSRHFGVKVEIAETPPARRLTEDAA